MKTYPFLVAALFALTVSSTVRAQPASGSNPDPFKSPGSGTIQSPETNADTLAEEIETPGRGQIKALITYAGNPVL